MGLKKGFRERTAAEKKDAGKKKSVKRKSVKRKSVKRKSVKRKSVKRKFVSRKGRKGPEVGATKTVTRGGKRVKLAYGRYKGRDGKFKTGWHVDKAAKKERKSVKRKSVKRKSVKRKSVKRKSVKRKSVKRKSVKRKSVKRKGPEVGATKTVTRGGKSVKLAYGRYKGRDGKIKTGWHVDKAAKKRKSAKRKVKKD